MPQDTARSLDKNTMPAPTTGSAPPGRSRGLVAFCLAAIAISAGGLYFNWRIDNRPGLAHYNEGMSLATAGDMAGAEKTLLEGTRLDPDYAPCYVELGDVYLKDSRFKESIDAYTKATHLLPTDGKLWFMLGSVLDNQHQDGAAADASFHAATLMPTDADAQAEYALIEDKLSKTDVAYTYYRKAHELAPMKPDYLITMCRFGLQEPSDADQLPYQETELSHYLAANPNDVDAALVMAQTDERLPPTPARTSIGIRNAQAVLSARPNEPAALAALAQLYLSANRVAEAGQTYQTALRSQPDSRDLLHGLLVCDTRLGKTADAAAVAKKLQSIP
jgi:tetratricopeptide (TPR) repeat protein